MEQLQGRVAVVTGAGSGIGRATSVALAARGCRLALVDRSDEGLAATAALLPGGADASTHIVDVTDRARLAELPGEVIDRHGACHVLVNNAGVTSAGPFADEPVADIDWIVDINVMGVVLGCHHFLPHLLEAEEAHIVNLSSMVAFVGLPRNALYSLTKGAVRSFTEGLRAELAGTSVGVTAVFPGAIHTNIVHSARGAQRSQLSSLGASRLAPHLMTSPEAAARRIVAAIERDRARALVGPDARMLDVLARLVPGRSGLIGRALDLVSPR